MSREARKRERKARNNAERTNPTPTPILPWKAARDPNTRWQNLTARGGRVLSFSSVGAKIPVDLDDPAAPHTLAMATMARGVVEA